ncbi:uncharacterized protein PG998_012209 [Apiospora kogelbergensis]|uniref:uncharacterized protein n=1 Tax=Apiospora kogelbergensis TaxID=1337665 RepID=UPI0031302FBE
MEHSSSHPRQQPQLICIQPKANDGNANQEDPAKAIELAALLPPLLPMPESINHPDTVQERYRLLMKFIKSTTKNMDLYMLTARYGGHITAANEKTYAFCKDVHLNIIELLEESQDEVLDGWEAYLDDRTDIEFVMDELRLEDTIIELMEKSWSELLGRPHTTAVRGASPHCPRADPLWGNGNTVMAILPLIILILVIALVVSFLES